MRMASDACIILDLEFPKALSLMIFDVFVSNALFHAVISVVARWPTNAKVWRHKTERGLKALTEPGIPGPVVGSPS